ncbi:MAG: thermonuclease family protein [Alphaproteobacteria bacterium]|nr:thermonuclease family protein [Alphaproteobacteria bacterium]
MRRRVPWLILAFALLAWRPAPAADLERAAAHTVIEVVDGDTVVLDDRSSVRLVGIQAPKLSLGRAKVADQPLAKESKAALEALTLGRAVTLQFGGLQMDRHGRHLAHLQDDQGRWVQGEMLRRGLARVYTFSDNRSWAADMLALEQEARREARGLWHRDYYRVRTAEEAGRYLGRYEVIEGRVVAAASNKGTVYLNFGPDWRSDFTVTISPRDLRSFRTSRLDPFQWKGRRVRVRGWLKSMNGPMIQATHPEQIEVLGE